MRVLVNAVRPLRGGIAVYLDELVAGLAADPEVELLVACRPEDSFRCPAEALHRFELKAWPRGILQERETLRRLCRDLRPDVLFSPIPLPPGRSPCASVVTVHDLNFKFIPVGFWRAKYRHVSFRSMAHNATALIAISEHTRDVLLEHYPKAAGKTHVVWNGFRAPDPLPELAADLSDAPYLLTFAHWPHKNAQAAVEVLAELNRERPRLRLQVVGASDEYLRQLERTAAELGVGGRLDRVRPPTADALYEAYAGALGLVFMSEYEGFGLPVFEALALGCPVVVSDRGALPEISSGHAEVVGLHDARAAAAHFRRHLEDAEWSLERRRRGRAYVLGWSWSRTVEKTTEVLRQVAG